MDILKSGSITLDRFGHTEATEEFDAESSCVVVRYSLESNHVPYYDLRVSLRSISGGRPRGSKGMTMMAPNGYPGVGVMAIPKDGRYRVEFHKPKYSHNKNYPVQIHTAEVLQTPELMMVRKPKTVREAVVDKLTPSGEMIVGDKTFYPMSIYADHRREDYGVYREAGFDTVMAATVQLRSGPNSMPQIEKAVDADMYYFLDITQYIQDLRAFDKSTRHIGWAVSRVPDDAERFQLMISRIEDVLNSKHGHRCLGLHVDNELWGMFSGPKAALAHLDRHPDISKLLRYVLFGNYGMAPLWTSSAMRFADWCGAYARGRGSAGASPGGGGHQVMRLNSTVERPVGLANMSGSVNVEVFERLIKAGLATGVSVWRDGARRDHGKYLDVTQQEWWEEFPDFAASMKSFKRRVVPDVQPSPEVSKPEASRLDVLSDQPEYVKRVELFEHGDWTIYGERF